MKNILKPALLGVAAALLVWIPTHTQAQGRGNFDPEQMRQQMMDRYKEALDVKSDDEWKVIEPRIQKVLDARREVGFGGMRGMFGPRRGGGQGGENADQGQNQRRRAFGAQSSPAAQALQKAIDSNAPADEIKSKLAAYRDDRKQKQENLEKAQEDLKKVLKSKQEAAAVLAGLLE
jgi:hypothetical protein